MNWKDINIKKGKEIYALQGDDFYKNNLDDLFIQQLVIILDKEVEEVEALPLDEVFSLRDDISFLRDAPRGDFEKQFIINNIEYKMIDLTKITLGEFMDLDMYSKEPINNIEYIMAVLYRPITQDKYDGSLVNERAELFLEKLSYETAAGAALFFSLLQMESTPHMMDSSMLDQVMKKINQRKKELEELLVKPKKSRKKKQKNNSNGI